MAFFCWTICKNSILNIWHCWPGLHAVPPAWKKHQLSTTFAKHISNNQSRSRPPLRFRNDFIETSSAITETTCQKCQSPSHTHSHIHPPLGKAPQRVPSRHRRRRRPWENEPLCTDWNASSCSTSSHSVLSLSSIASGGRPTTHYHQDTHVWAKFQLYLAERQSSPRAYLDTAISCFALSPSLSMRTLPVRPLHPLVTKYNCNLWPIVVIPSTTVKPRLYDSRVS